MHERNLHELFTAVPLLAVQMAMAATAARWAKQRFSPGGNGALRLGIAVLLLLELVTVARDFAPSGWKQMVYLVPHFGSARTAIYMWLFPCAPAYVIFLLHRALLRRRGAGDVDHGRRQLIQAAGTLAMAAPFALEGYGALVGRLNFQVRETELQIKDLHRDLDGLRILQLSDIHLSPYLSVKELARVIDASNELRPHVALMTGDLISSLGDPLDACLEQLKRVRADAGMLGCLGNHERYTDTEAYATRKGASMGIKFLRHESRQVRVGDAAINFAGVDYLPFAMRGRYLPHARSLQRAGALNILLSHNPDVFPEAAAQGWDVTLSGHTHGGQVTVEILDQTLNFARAFTRYVSGLYQKDESLCYVTRGIGTIGIPARVGAMPEITLLRLRKI